MTYFTSKYLEFFEHLAGDNSKDWFDVHRSEYHTHVKDAFSTFVTECIGEIRKQDDPQMHLETKNAVFRVNRDIRFAKDKTPYKLHMAACLSRRGRKDLQYPGLYIQLGQKGLMLACGAHHLDKKNLTLVRKAIMKEPERVEKLIKARLLHDLFGKPQGEKNKILPKEFKEAGTWIPLLYNKQFYFSTTYAPDTILREDLLEFVLQHWFAAKEWNEFLKEAMGLE